MANFDVPKGDPTALREVARKVQTMSTTVGQTRRKAITGPKGTAASALPTRRVSDFDAAAKPAIQTVDTVAMSLGTVSGALSTYADALETAQRKVRKAKSDYDGAHSAYVSAVHSAHPGGSHIYEKAMTRHEQDAANAHDDLRAKARTAAAALSGELHVWVPSGAKTPIDAWSSASNNILPVQARLNPEQLKAAYRDLKLPEEAVSKAVKTGLKGWQGWNLMRWLRSASISRKAEDEYAKARAEYQALKGSNPDLADSKTYKAYLKSERSMLKAFSKSYPQDAIKAQQEYKFLRSILGDKKALSRLKAANPGLTEAEIVGRAGKFARLLKPVRAISPVLTKVLGPVSIAAGAWDIYSSVTDDNMSLPDKGVHVVGGLGSIAAGAAPFLVMAGLVSNPVGWGILVGGSLVAVGAWAYENRKAIWHGMKWTGGKIKDGAEWVGHKAEDLGGAVKDVAGDVWHGVFG